jgi:D-3-phosphoglycerate dehydrogenase
VEVVDLTKVEPGGIRQPEKLIPYVADADAVIVQFANIDARVIGAMEKCRVIARYAIGVDVIDVGAATKKNIFVANVPDYCVFEVANTAIAHILNAVRKLSASRDMLLGKDFDMSKIRPVMRIEEATLCLLGFGNISRDVYKKMKQFFKRIVVFDPYLQNDERYSGIEFMGFEKAVSVSDVISVHVPLNADTKGMIDAAAFSCMKDGVIIVNTARGPVIDEGALVAALESGKVGFAGWM